MQQQHQKAHQQHQKETKALEKKAKKAAAQALLDEDEVTSSTVNAMFQSANDRQAKAASAAMSIPTDLLTSQQGGSSAWGGGAAAPAPARGSLNISRSGYNDTIPMGGGSGALRAPPCS